MAARTGCVLAFDFGDRHIGVAVGQTVTRTASPLTTLRARSGTPDWSEVGRLLEEWQPIRLLVGLPLNMDDSEGEMAARARAFARRLSRRWQLPVDLVDERLTSFETRGASDSHAAAAALIAETYLAGQS